VNAHLPIDAYSPGHVNTLIDELQTYRSALRDAAVRAKATKTAAKTTHETSEALANLLRSSNVQPDDTKNLEALNKELHELLKTAPVMHLTLAASASRTLKRQLTVWFRTQVHPLSLLTFAVRSDIGGGVMLQAGSHFYDYSFRDRIIANKSRLMELASVR
jgi:F0F1-type ATP synthase delta subunit